MYSLSLIRHTSFRWRSLQPETLPNTFRTWALAPPARPSWANERSSARPPSSSGSFTGRVSFTQTFNSRTSWFQGTPSFSSILIGPTGKRTLSNSEVVKNLLRLNRSAEKWIRRGLRITRADRLRFLVAYAGDDFEIREAVRRALGSRLIRALHYSL